MELQQLRYFLDAAETQHVTQSAERLHIAQPALTQSIRRLERELDVPLFMPKGRGIVLTECGQYLREHLVHLMKELDDLPQQLQELAAKTRNTVRLNVLAASELTTEAVIAYQSTHECVRFQMTQNAQSDLHDIAITTKFFYQSDRHRESAQFCKSERIFLAVPAQGKYGKLESIRLNDVQDEGFISLQGSRQMRWICDKFCRHAGFQPKILFESDSPATVRNMIAANIGIGFWPEATWGAVNSDRVRLLKIIDPVCQRDLLITRSVTNSDFADDFFRFLSVFFDERIKQVPPEI